MSRPPARLGIALLAVVIVLLLGGARPAVAHTGLASSTPAADSTVADPVAEITLVFTQAVSPVEGGYEALAPDGQVRAPAAVTTPAPDTIVVAFDPPLAGGPVGLRWSAASDDGHIVQGSFAFTVTAPAPTTTTAPPPTTTTTVAPTTTLAPAAAVVTTVPASTTTTTTTSSTTSTSVVHDHPAAPSTTVSLDDFLGARSDRTGDLQWRRGAQIVGIPAALVAIGLLAFVRAVAPWARRLLRVSAVAGLVAAIAAVVEAAGHAGAVTGRGLGVITDLGATADAHGSSYGTALVLRLAGGGLLALGAAMIAPRRARAGWPVGAVGAGALVVSDAFDGHTVSRGNRVVQSLADVVHVGAAAVWAGGVVALAWLAWRRWRRGDDVDVTAAVLRFSGLAAWVLVPVVGAGVVMALGILDWPGDLTATPWGKTLLVKSAATGLAIAVAAYNRYRLLPALEADDTPAHRERVVDALGAEAVLLAVAAIAAGVLAGAAA